MNPLRQQLAMMVLAYKEATPANTRLSSYLLVEKLGVYLWKSMNSKKAVRHDAEPLLGSGK
jgi:hypothetical protein